MTVAVAADETEGVAVRVREFDACRDSVSVEALERICEVGPTGKMSLFTDLLGDPVCRVRHSPAYLMLVAETCGPAPDIVGLVRGCVKTVVCGTQKPQHHLTNQLFTDGAETASARPSPIYAKVAYLLGLRVSPSHRRRGIALKLVQRMEEWFKENGAEYAYMATEKCNEASIRLFTGRCGYTKFRTPAILVQPVFAHRLTIPSRSVILRLSPDDAEKLYRRRFAATEFFPRDIDAVLRNPLSLGTFLTVPRSFEWAGVDAFLASPPESWAVLSVWNTRDVFRLEVRGAPLWRRSLATASRAVDQALPWLKVPSVPDVFRPFGFYFLYGVGGEGPDAAAHLRALCRHSNNMARELSRGEIKVVATEVAACEPLRPGIPHWRRLSCEEDLWCVKRLAAEEGYSDGSFGDWTKAPPSPSIFVDPREI